MNRFEKKPKIFPFWKGLLSLVITIAVVFGFAFSMNSISAGTTDQQKQNLEDALRRNVIQCYIAEGSYPESLEYLENNYPLLYDETQFKIDYQPIGENLMPSITVLIKSN